MVSGLSAVADEADMLWVCAALSDDDRAAARLAPDGLLDLADAGAGAAVRMLDIPEPIFYRAYNAVANSTLWFVHHMLYDTPNQPSFGPGFARDWEAFRTYNEMFAAALASAAASSLRADREPVRAVIQDYHLCLAPRLLAERAPSVRIAHFSHTPWAPPDYYRMLPDDVGREVLAGISALTTPASCAWRWADAFADCCAAFLGAEVDSSRSRVGYLGHVTSIGVHPLGVDAGQLRDRAGQRDVLTRRAALMDAAAGRQADRPGRPHRAVQEHRAGGWRPTASCSGLARSGVAESCTWPPLIRPGTICLSTASTQPRCSGSASRSRTSSPSPAGSP